VDASPQAQTAPGDRFHGLPLVPKDWRYLLLLAAVLGALPLYVQKDYLLLLLNVMALNALVVLGLNILIGCAGQISFGHAAFYGMGAYLSAIATGTWGWPLAAGLLFALAVTAVAGFLLALPTLRLEGHYLVMATLGFNIIVSIVFNQAEGITGGPSGFYGIPGLQLGPWSVDTDREFYYFIWPLFLIVFALSLNLADSRLGRALHAIHEKDLTARVLGVPAHRYKVISFIISALYAALAGFCYAHYIAFISPKTFDIFYSVEVVMMVVVGGLGSLWGGLAGTVLLTGLPELLHRFEDLHVVAYGLILVLVLMYCPKGLLPTLAASAPVRRVRRAAVRARAGEVPPGPEEETVPRGGSPLPGDAEEAASATRGSASEFECARSGPEPDSSPVLELREVSIHFGGLQALGDVSVQVHAGEIVALIGPNGAGKTTLLNVVSGLLQPQNGSIHFRGRPIDGLTPHRVAERGVGRTFQAVQIYQRFSVLENVLLGYHVRGRAGFAASYLHSPGERIEERRLRERGLELLREFGLGKTAHLSAGQLSLFQRKLLELARALAPEPALLLLDEPVGGLNPRESEALVEHLGRVRGRGIGIVLVEHDMNVVMRVADRVEVLQHGVGIASGTPGEIQRNPRVIRAYLGTGGLAEMSDSRDSA
jgi:branched-chain amino acid transport system permease protein